MQLAAVYICQLDTLEFAAGVCKPNRKEEARSTRNRFGARVCCVAAECGDALNPNEVDFRAAGQCRRPIHTKSDLLYYIVPVPGLLSSGAKDVIAP